MTNQIATFFDSYREAFNALDAVAISRHFALPCILMDGALILWTGHEQVVANMQALTGRYRDGGFVRSSYAVAALLPQGEDNAVANLLWTVQRDGRPDWQFHAGYNLRCFEDGWKIVFCTAYEERAVRQQS